VTVIDEEVLAKIPGSALRVHAVFLPMLEDDNAAAAARTFGRLRDKRFTGYWDPKHAVSRAVHKALGLPERLTAWDVYLAYGPGRKAGGTLPAPDFWMHQLSKLTERKDLELDGKKFLAALGPFIARK
jgi:hypothetical protein